MVTHYLLDTNQLSQLIENHPAVVTRVALFGMERTATSPIVCGELAYMAYRSGQIDHNLNRVMYIFNNVKLLPIDHDVALIYGRIKQAIIVHFGPKDKIKRSGIRLEQLGFNDHDIWIAATAIRYDHTLVSADSDFKRIHEVHPFKLESWWVPES